MRKGLTTGLSGYEHASPALRREFIDGIRDDLIETVLAGGHHKQIPGPVKRQTLCAAQYRAKGGSTVPTQSSHVIPVDVAAQIGHEQIAHHVKRQVRRAIGAL